MAPFTIQWECSAFNTHLRKGLENHSQTRKENGCSHQSLSTWNMYNLHIQWILDSLITCGVAKNSWRNRSGARGHCCVTDHKVASPQLWNWLPGDLCTTVPKAPYIFQLFSNFLRIPANGMSQIANGAQRATRPFHIEWPVRVLSDLHSGSFQMLSGVSRVSVVLCGWYIGQIFD